MRHAAKLQEIDTKAFLPDDEEESKEHATFTVKSDKDCIQFTNRINSILDKYQEQSSVLDTILEQFVSPIMAFLQEYVRKSVAAEKYGVTTEVKALFLILCQLSKVRGYKTVVKFFPHEVSDMEQVTELLHFQDTHEWQVPYILVLWLSIIVLVPFDLSTIDS